MKDVETTAEAKPDELKPKTPNETPGEVIAPKPESKPLPEIPAETAKAETEFQKFINAPERLTVLTDDKGKAEVDQRQFKIGRRL